MLSLKFVLSTETTRVNILCVCALDVVFYYLKCTLNICMDVKTDISHVTPSILNVDIDVRYRTVVNKLLVLGQISLHTSSPSIVRRPIVRLVLITELCGKDLEFVRSVWWREK